MPPVFYGIDNSALPMHPLKVVGDVDIKADMLKEAVKQGDVQVQRYTNGGPFAESPGDGVIEMPHYPEPHRAYASVTVIEKDGNLVIPQGSKVR